MEGFSFGGIPGEEGDKIDVFLTGMVSKYFEVDSQQILTSTFVSLPYTAL